ncbi:MAG TPA: hypothetical protein VGL86_15075, partial [Polyangia bacterium]
MSVSDGGVWMVIGAEVAGALITGAPLLASVPDAVEVKVVVPAPVALKIHVKVRDVPPAMSCAGGLD